MELYKHFLASTGVSTDTRQLQGGELFFCLRGDNFNGNRFASQALEKGAAMVVVDDVDYYQDTEAMLLVEDSLQSLQNLAKHHRQQLIIPVIGITGTNGKTTTKELVATVLAQKYKVLATEGNFNNHIGVPLTLLNITHQHQIAVVEMGANHAGEIAQLCEIAQPTHGIITNVGQAHLEGFGNFETLLQTKLALYKAVAQAQGTLFVNGDDNTLMTYLPTVETIRSYAIEGKVHIQLDILQNTPLHLQWENKNIGTQLFGQYNAYNVAAAICIGQYFKVQADHIITALESYQPQNNRSQIVKGKSNTLIMDAYNANPSSMQGAIACFLDNSLSQVHKMLILGDMFELGDFSPVAHKAVLQQIQNYQKDKQYQNLKVYLVGHHFGQWQRAYPVFAFFESVESIQTHLQRQSIIGYEILLKGSRAIGLERLQNVLMS